MAYSDTYFDVRLVLSITHLHGPKIAAEQLNYNVAIRGAYGDRGRWHFQGHPHHRTQPLSSGGTWRMMDDNKLILKDDFGTWAILENFKNPVTMSSQGDVKYGRVRLDSSFHCIWDVNRHAKNAFIGRELVGVDFSDNSVRWHESAWKLQTSWGSSKSSGFIIGGSDATMMMEFKNGRDSFTLKIETVGGGLMTKGASYAKSFKDSWGDHSPLVSAVGSRGNLLSRPTDFEGGICTEDLGTGATAGLGGNADYTRVFFTDLEADDSVSNRVKGYIDVWGTSRVAGTPGGGLWVVLQKGEARLLR